ncbi:hypothetical protein, partial [Akkermansia sp.]|uniref:hypothetical protein n=1 Tax=Akkermansia sp. TaxID=1872421 RepID=UPI003AB10356
SFIVKYLFFNKPGIGLEIRADVIPLFGDAVFKRKDLMCGRRQWLKHTENPFPHRAGKGLP